MNTSPDELNRAVDWIRRGGIVAFPTETFYGLAVDPSQPAAVLALFDAKGRGAASALPLIGGSRADVERICGPLDPNSGRLADLYWPGPLSLVLEAPAVIAREVHGGSGTVAVRVPDHPLARGLAAALGHLITATSANRSGESPATDPGELGGLARDPRIFVLAGGSTPGGAPSTIVDARQEPARLVRDGAVPWDRVLRSLNG